ncbi:MAG: hypothetical protein GY792_05295 [Gammaproteobacteria bacterium]|nr:hypothetical protein [Gammaproteobacteria bacterium]
MIEKSESNQLSLATAPILGQAPSAPSSWYCRVQLVCQRSGQGASRSEWLFPLQEAQRRPGR